MRAIVAHAAKDLRVEEAADPGLGPEDIRVRVAFGGICGSDLHYYNHGGFGAVRLREPMILGHEIAGVVEAVGAEASRVKVGDRVAVSPSVPCNHCRYCLEGLQNQCLDMRFYGSAMRFPHVQGAFRESLVCLESQAHPVADGVTLQEAAMAEPLAVALHATRRAGSLMGRRVLVSGSGPIGALVVSAARRAGAAEIVVTDIADGVLGFRDAHRRGPRRSTSPRRPKRSPPTPRTKAISTRCSRPRARKPPCARASRSSGRAASSSSSASAAT